MKVQESRKSMTYLAVPLTENVSEKTVSTKVITHLQFL